MRFVLVILLLLMSISGMAQEGLTEFDDLNLAKTILNQSSTESEYYPEGNDEYEPDPECNTIKENLWQSVIPRSDKPICYYITIKSNAILEFFAIDQTDTKQVKLTVMDDPLNNNDYIAIGTSNSSSTSDKYRFFAEPGNYYVYLETVLGDGTAIKVGAAVNYVKADNLEDISVGKDYTGNDISPYRFKNGTLTGEYAYLHDTQDVDNYLLQSYWGQDLYLRITPQKEYENEIVIEAFANGEWVPLKPGLGLIFSNLENNSAVLIRVRARDVTKTLKSGFYSIEAGSYPKKIIDKTPDGERGARVRKGSANYRRVQNFTRFSWKAQVVDSRGRAISNVKMHFKHRSSENDVERIDRGVTDARGERLSEIDLGPPCSGKHSVSYADGLEIRYDIGSYIIEIRPTGFNTPAVISTKDFGWLRLCSVYNS